MGDSTRICSYCRTPNKGAHRYCVRCSAPLDAGLGPVRPMVMAPRPAPSRVSRYLLAAGVVAAIAAGFMVHAVVQATHEVPALSEDVHAAEAATVLPPPPVSGWTPGGSAPVDPEPAPPTPTAPAWTSSAFPVARPMPSDMPVVAEAPGDPAASMVGIAPRAPRARAAVAGRRSFTDDDLLATRAPAN